MSNLNSPLRGPYVVGFFIHHFARIDMVEYNFLCDAMINPWLSHATMISPAGNEGFIWLLWGIISVAPFLFVVRFFLHDGQLVGVHKTSWFVAIIYVFGIMSSAIAGFGRALIFNYVPTVTATDAQVRYTFSSNRHALMITRWISGSQLFPFLF